VVPCAPDTIPTTAAAPTGPGYRRQVSTSRSSSGSSPGPDPIPDPAGALRAVAERVASCRICPRLVEWREEVAATRRAAYADQRYWGRPVPGFGDPRARLVVVGLAPAAHGANRTGRMFTGDRSGDWLYRALWRAGYASQPESTALDDGLVLTDAYVTAPVKCAPPANKPLPAERDACRHWLADELELLDRARVFVALGRFGFDAMADHLGLRPRPRFAHGVEVDLGGGRTLLGCFHVSQQNTFTGRLTEPMLDVVFARAHQLGSSPAGGSAPL
jgi:uracil-DNA glycosylase family 4